MTMGSGYNAMKWDCKTDGCFNRMKRPKIEVFAGCFPGNMNFGDVDAIIEIGGRGLVLEWKNRPGALQDGQRIMWSRLTRGCALTVLCAAGDAESMTVTHRALFWDGRWFSWREADLAGLKASAWRWAKWAQANRLDDRGRS